MRSSIAVWRAVAVRRSPWRASRNLDRYSTEWCSPPGWPAGRAAETASSTSCAAWASGGRTGSRTTPRRKLGGAVLADPDEMAGRPGPRPATLADLQALLDAAGQLVQLLVQDLNIRITHAITGELSSASSPSTPTAPTRPPAGRQAPGIRKHRRPNAGSRCPRCVERSTWWQVLGSNQRRLSRRFYRPILLHPAQIGCLRKRQPGRRTESFRPPCVRARHPGWPVGAVCKAAEQVWR